MQKLDGKSLDIVSENVAKLKEIFPEVFCEGKVDFEKLKNELGKFIEKDKERYNFTWAGKQNAKKIAQTPSTGTLRPAKEESKNWDSTQNLYIEGDNLEVLKLLQKSYHKQVKMIYIDPPYNTGKDFVYKDNFKDNIKNYLELTGQVDSEGNRLSINADTNGRYHSDWLSMMYPRLKLARNLLKDDGIIFISIDDNEVANLRKLCDEIFGEGNFVATYSRISKKGSSMGKFVSPAVDYVLCYLKNIDLHQGFVFPQTDEYIKNFKYEDDKGKYKTTGLYQSSLDPLRGCINQRYYIECPDGTLVIPPGENFPKEKFDGAQISPLTKQDKVWRWSVETYKKEKNNLVFVKTKNSPLVDSNGKKSIWNVLTKQYLKSEDDSKVVPSNIIENCFKCKSINRIKRNRYKL